jgi:large subunit ribosomal protein L17
MRHNRAGRKLGRVSEHRRALFRNQLLSLMQHERIITTLPKAKELRPIAERMVTLGRKNTVHARRLAARWIADREVIKKLFSEIAPRFANRPGGYTRIVKLGPRKGDGAELAILEFVDYKLPEAAKEKKEQKQKKAKPEELRQEQPQP